MISELWEEVTVVMMEAKWEECQLYASNSEWLSCQHLAMQHVPVTLPQVDRVRKFEKG